MGVERFGIAVVAAVIDVLSGSRGERCYQKQGCGENACYEATGYVHYQPPIPAPTLEG